MLHTDEFDNALDLHCFMFNALFFSLCQGCYEKVKDLIFGNVYIVAGTLGGIGLIQVCCCFL